MRLDGYQDLFMRAVRFRPTPPELVRAVEGGGALSDEDGVEVYRSMYWYRLVDAHFSLLPKTSTYLGGKAFTKAVCACLTTQPSCTGVLERLALPFARYLQTSDVDLVAKDLAMLEGQGIESLLAPDAEAPPFERSDAKRSDLAELSVAPLPSLRAVKASRRAVALFEVLSTDPEVREEGLSVEECRELVGHDQWRDADGQGPVGVVLVRPRFSVETHRIDAGELELVQPSAGQMNVGSLLVALAGPDADPMRAFRRFANFIDNSFFVHA